MIIKTLKFGVVSFQFLLHEVRTTPKYSWEAHYNPLEYFHYSTSCKRKILFSWRKFIFLLLKYEIEMCMT